MKKLTPKMKKALQAGLANPDHHIGHTMPEPTRKALQRRGCIGKDGKITEVGITAATA